MSEESPPPLRLKPRLSPAGEEASPPASTPPPNPPPSVAEATAPEASRLRLKPKLAAEPVAQLATETTTEPAPAAESENVSPAEKFRLKPKLNPEPVAEVQPAATATEIPDPAVADAAPTEPPPSASVATPTSAPQEPAAEEALKFKLKPKAAGAASPVPQPLAPPSVAAAPVAAPPVIPAPAVPGVGSPPPPPSVKRPPPPAAALKKKLMVVGGAAALFMVIGGLYYVWQTMGDQPPAPVPPVVQTQAPTPAVNPPEITPSETLNQIAAMPGVAISKAEDAIAATLEREQEQIDTVSTGGDTPESRVLSAPSPGQPGGAEAPVGPTISRTESELAPGVRATTSEVTATAQASSEFRAFVGAMTISGVFQGTPPRALINGRTYRAGNVVDQIQGIVFEGADPATKTITFRDRTGARVSRRY